MESFAMSIAESNPAIRLSAARPARQASRVRIATSVGDLRSAWQTLVTSGHSTPFQQPRFVAAVLSARLDGQQAEPFFVVVEGANGEPLAIFPFVIERQMGLRVARFAGGTHASYKMGLFAEGFSGQIEPATLRALLTEAGSHQQVDLYNLVDQPLVWEGFANPLAGLPRQTSPSVGYRTALMPDAAAFIRTKMSNESYKKLKRKEKRLGDLGALRYIEPTQEAEVRPVLDAYLAQKAARFQSLGMKDPFAGAAVRNFLRQATVCRPGATGPVISLHALVQGERVLAVFGGVAADGRFSAMFTSFDAAPDVARFSPGDCLLLRLVTALGERGFRTFDLGVGDAGYKKDYCESTDELFDSFIPLTVSGKVAAALLSASRRAKGHIKASPGLMQAAARLRRLRAGLRPTQAPATAQVQPAAQ